MEFRMKKLLPSTSSSEGGSITLVSRACSRRMDPRGARMTAKTFLLVFAFALTFLFVACGDDDSSSFVEPEKESSSSEILSSSDGTSDGNGDKSSSRVSSSTTNSSSSAKSSSSTDSKSSSSATPESSSEEFFVECDTEGQISYMLVESVRTRFICENGRLVEFPESSSSVKSSSSYFNMSKQYNDKEWIKYEMFVDPRDNQEYRTITVEKEAYNRTLVILAGNLNYGKMVTAKTATYSDGVVEKFCYNDDPWYCENGFGGLYTWSEAMGLPRACDTVALGSTPECPEATGIGEDGRRQGVCPEGWHVMNEREWRMMPISEGFGASPMLSQVFSGDDDIGLAVLLGGVYRESYNGLGKYVEFWYMEEHSKESHAPTFASSMEISALSGQKVDFGAVEPKLSKLPVRCVKDY